MAFVDDSMSGRKSVRLDEVSFSYGTHAVISNLTLDFEEGEVATILGPSGCGKSTLLRLLAGLETPNAGLCNIGPKKAANASRLRYLFQDFDALPWLTVEDNIRLGAADTGHAEFLVHKLGLSKFRNVFPSQISGGMRKRLALGRCLAGQPDVLLLDEPFVSLDVATKSEMYALLQAIWLDRKMTVILVTHDIHEAILLSSRVLISSNPFNIVRTVFSPFDFPRTELDLVGELYLSLREEITGTLTRNFESTGLSS